MAKPQLRTVPTETIMDASLEADGQKLQQLVGADAPVAAAAALASDDFGEDISGAMERAAQLPDVGDPKTLVARARATMQKRLDDLAARKAAIERRMAEIEERRRMEVAEANGRADAELVDADADLSQIAACREAFDLAVGRLNRA